MHMSGDKKGLGDKVAAGELSSVVAAAHELKSPLVLLRQLTFALEHAASDEERARLLARMQLTSERALRLTTDLTRAARLEDSLFELEPINVKRLCEDVAHELTPLFAAHGRQIVVRRIMSPPLAIGHRDLLHRIVTNFSDNALHYGGENGRVELSIHARVREGLVRVGVRDYGPALPTNIWRSITRKLATPQPVQARPQSSGLGIYLADAFARSMGGTVGATRHRDGSTFYVELPISEQLSLL